MYGRPNIIDVPLPIETSYTKDAKMVRLNFESSACISQKQSSHSVNSTKEAFVPCFCYDNRQ